MKPNPKSPARIQTPVQSAPPQPAITSQESLDVHLSDIVRLRAQRAARLAELEARVAAVQEEFARPITELDRQLLRRETCVHAYCHAHRAELFAAKKSRETLAAVVGFELTPHRVETVGRKITWKIVVGSLLGLDWGRGYVRHPAQQGRPPGRPPQTHPRPTRRRRHPFRPGRTILHPLEK